VYYV